jgi:polysaccharide biosynthesis protein PelD
MGVGPGQVYKEVAVNSAAVQSEASSEAKPRTSDPFGNLGPVRRFLAPAVPRPYAILETIAFMAAVLVVTSLVNRADPLLMHTGFPWIWLAPLVVALRYGTLLGVLAGLMILGLFPLAYPHEASLPLMFAIGGLVQTILVGHFGDTWGVRAERSRSINDYLNDRLVAITNSHYLMRLSHERLEKDLLAKPTTLRDSIAELRRLSIEHGLPQPGVKVDPRSLPGVNGLLEFVAQACQIEMAGLYPFYKGKVGKDAIARIGDTFEFDPADELVTHAVNTLAVAHLRSEDAPVATTQYVVCAPLVSADGELLAVLVVKRMPFLSLNFDNLQLLLVLLAYYADGVEHSSHVQRIMDIVPDCPYEFALDLARLERLQSGARIGSSLIALSFPRSEEGDSLFEHVIRRRRSLDVLWPLRTPTQSVLINLMPATDSIGIDGYIERIETGLGNQFDTDLEEARVGVHTLHLDGVEPGPALLRLLRRSGVEPGDTANPHNVQTLSIRN